MSEEEEQYPIIKPLNFWLHLILLLVTGTIWEPFYYFFCLRGLNKLDKYPKPADVPSTKNNVLLNVLLVITIIGAPFVYYKRIKLLREYINSMNNHLEPILEEVNEKGEKVETKRLNVIEPMKFVGFAITSILLTGVLVASFTIALIYLIPYNENLSQTPIGNLWERGAFMIILLLGITTFFLSLAFSVRTIQEEKKWVEVFNSISQEVMNENNIEIPNSNKKLGSVSD